MTTLLLLVALGGTTPETLTGAELEAARAVDAPIRDVTVYSDRARIHRRGRVTLARGLTPVRLPLLPGAVDPASLRLAAEGARVVWFDAVAREADAAPLDALEAALAKVDALADHRAELAADLATAGAELESLARLSPRAPEPREAAWSPQTWREVWAFVDARRGAAQREVLALERALADGDAELAAARDALDLVAPPGGPRRVVAVTALLEASADAGVELDLAYLTQGAAWWPSYELHFDPAAGSVRLLTSARIAQSSGEPWTDVALELSTAVPGSGLDLPELPTWTLGERRDFRPVYRARTPPPGSPPAPPVAPTAAEDARRELLSRRLGELRGDAAGVRYRQQLRRTGAAPAPSEPEPRETPPPPQLERYELTAESSAEGDSWDVADSITGSLSSSSSESRRWTPLALEEPHAPLALPGDPTLPAALTGGLRYLYIGARRADVPSTGEQVVVPLRTDVYPVELQHRTVPALQPTAFMRATVKNRGAQPILAGPAAIFVGGDYAGAATLRTTGPGGRLELPLGADEDLRVQRTQVLETRSAGLFGGDDLTTYATTIEVGNYGARTAQLVVADQLPRSRNGRIEIELEDSAPTPSAGPDADGVLQWELELQPGATTSVRFVYSVRRPSGWELHQP